MGNTRSCDFSQDGTRQGLGFASRWFFGSISGSSKCTQREPGCWWDLRAFIGTSEAFIGSPQLCSQGAEAGGLAPTGESLPSWVSNAAWELGKGERTYAPARPALFVELAHRLDARQGVLCCLVGLCCSIPAPPAVPWGCPRDGFITVSRLRGPFSEVDGAWGAPTPKSPSLYQFSKKRVGVGQKVRAEHGARFLVFVTPLPPRGGEHQRGALARLGWGHPQCPHLEHPPWTCVPPPHAASNACYVGEQSHTHRESPPK